MIIFVIHYHGVSLCDILVLYESINKCPKGSFCTYNQACWNIISCHLDRMFNFVSCGLVVSNLRECLLHETRLDYWVLISYGRVSQFC